MSRKSRCQVSEKQVSGARCQVSGPGGWTRIRDSGFGSQDEERLLSADCLLLPVGCRLFPADWLLSLIELAGVLAHCQVSDTLSQWRGEEKTSNFKK